MSITSELLALANEIKAFAELAENPIDLEKRFSAHYRVLHAIDELRESEVVSEISVEEDRKRDEEDAYERMLFEDFP